MTPTQIARLRELVRLGDMATSGVWFIEPDTDCDSYRTGAYFICHPKTECDATCAAITEGVNKKDNETNAQFITAAANARDLFKAILEEVDKNDG